MKPKHIISLIVLVALGAGVWYFGMKDDEPASTNNPTNNTQNSENNSNSSEQPEVVSEVPNGFVGELRVSSDKKRGNLMLMLKDSDRIIYLNTSRDFSSLIGKQVRVTIEGSLDDFRLIDIKAE
jgi:hypothetical protein